MKKLILALMVSIFSMSTFASTCMDGNIHMISTESSGSSSGRTVAK